LTKILIIYFKEDLLVEPNPKLYHFISQGMTTIDGVDDAEEMKLTDEAFDILNFSQV
jgi:myosin heavy chain 6/7